MRNSGSAVVIADDVALLQNDEGCLHIDARAQDGLGMGHEKRTFLVSSSRHRKEKLKNLVTTLVASSVNAVDAP